MRNSFQIQSHRFGNPFAIMSSKAARKFSIEFKVPYFAGFLGEFCRLFGILPTQISAGPPAGAIPGLSPSWGGGDSWP